MATGLHRLSRRPVSRRTGADAVWRGVGCRVAGDVLLLVFLGDGCYSGGAKGGEGYGCEVYG